MTYSLAHTSKDIFTFLEFGIGRDRGKIENSFFPSPHTFVHGLPEREFVFDMHEISNGEARGEHAIER